MRDPLIIGLIGRAGAGKDTAADYLCTAHGFERYAFAQPLKTMLEALFVEVGIDYARLFEPSLKEQPIELLGGVSPSGKPLADVQRLHLPSLAWRPPPKIAASAAAAEPVSVAISTIARGLLRAAYCTASARTRRPSASVFCTSTVLPPKVRTTSPGRWALPSGIFSASAITATT